MNNSRNIRLMELTKEIVVAKLTNPSTPPVQMESQSVADFIQSVYDKLVELSENVS